MAPRGTAGNMEVVSGEQRRQAATRLDVPRQVRGLDKIGVDNTNDITVTFGSLFSGAGGLDLGLERAGLKCVFQVENDRHCLTILNRHWPNVPKNEIRPCVGLVGGDPCPIRSTMGKISGSRKPDLSGYFLAMAARIKPRWILRENVVAPDVVEFNAGLEVLGYHCIIIATNSASPSRGPSLKKLSLKVCEAT